MKCEICGNRSEAMRYGKFSVCDPCVDSAIASAIERADREFVKTGKIKCAFCPNEVESEISYHVLCDECNRKRMKSYAHSYAKRKEDEEE